MISIQVSGTWNSVGDDDNRFGGAPVSREWNCASWRRSTGEYSALVGSDRPKAGSERQFGFSEHRGEEVKVVDLSTGVAGQWAAKLFAMAGAEVVRPEGGERPDQVAR